MKNIMLAIAAVALAALAPFALAAEGDSDRDPNAGVSQPTMRELANKIDHVEAGACPRLFATFWRDGSGHSTEWPRLNDGFGIYTFTAPTRFRMQHRFPTGFVATDDKPLASYIGAVRITKLK